MLYMTEDQAQQAADRLTQSTGQQHVVVPNEETWTAPEWWPGDGFKVEPKS